MGLEDLNYKVFQTTIYKSTYMSKRFRTCKYFRLIKKNRHEFACFDFSIAKHIIPHAKLSIYENNLEQIKDLKSEKVKIAKKKIECIVYHINETILNINGKLNHNLRYAYNKYKNNAVITMSSKLNNPNQIIDFLKLWRQENKKKNLMDFTGKDINFIESYYSLYQDKLLTFTFYIDNKIVACAIVEKIDHNKINLLIRKA